MRKALLYVRNNFKTPITLEDVAKIMNVSPIYASKQFHKTLGCGFKEYLVDLRLTYAASMLSYTEESISNISYFSGYNSVSHFSKGFKKKYGLSPANFRKSKQNSINEIP